VPRMVPQPDGSYLVDARLEMDEFERLVGPIITDEEKEDIDTVGGLVFSIEGRIPARGELVSHPAGVEFEVVDADPRRIRRLRMRRIVAEETVEPARAAR